MNIANKIRNVIDGVSPWLDVRPFEPKLEGVYQKHQIESSLYVIAAFCLVAGIAFGSMLVLQLLQPGASTHHNLYTTILRGATSVFLIHTAFMIFFLPETTDQTGVRMFKMFLVMALLYPVLLIVKPLDSPSTTELALASILYCTSFSFRLNYRRYKIFFSIAVVAYFFSFFLLRGAFAPNGATAPIFDIAARMPADYVPLLQLVQAATLSYLIYRFSDARERRLFLGEQKIASSNATRLQLLQSVGHDLRQPMTSILLQQGIAIEAARQENRPLLLQSLAVIESSLQIMSAELNQITEIAALQSEDFELKISPVLLEPLIENVIALFRAQSQKNHIEIYLEISSKLPNVYVASNSAMLTSILINLISNAIKYSKDKSDAVDPSVTVSVVEIAADGIQISVTDNGVGISEDNLLKIWTPFFQVNNPERARSKGYGLGLAHVQVAVARLGGHKVSFTSVIGVGSTFKLELPVTSRDNSAEPKLSTQSFPIRLDGEGEKLILIVDDESTVRKSLATSLHQVGYLTEEFATVFEACEFIRCTPKTIYVALVDYRLADGTGADIFRFLINQLGDDSSGGPRLICLSGEGLVEKDLAIEFPSVRFVRKPVSSRELSEILK